MLSACSLDKLQRNCWNCQLWRFSRFVDTNIIKRIFFIVCSKYVPKLLDRLNLKKKTRFIIFIMSPGHRHRIGKIVQFPQYSNNRIFGVLSSAQSPSIQINSSYYAFVCRSRGRTSTESRARAASFDIDNIVIPQSVAASTRPEILHYKEIQTPKSVSSTTQALSVTQSLIELTTDLGRFYYYY